MKYFIIILCAGIIFCSTFFSCKKDKNDENIIVNDTLKFDSLVADSYVIPPLTGETKIRAYAKGEELKYSWNVVLGDFSGSGSVVTYKVSPCTYGDIDITCKVTDKAKKSLSRTITISVK
jgi:hypothetical protein